MKFSVVTVFPELVRDISGWGIFGKALEKSQIELDIVNLRDYTHDRHRTTDDYIYGGGSGMVMKPEPFYEFMDDYTAKNSDYRVIYPSPQGKRFENEDAVRLANYDNLVFFCGRYEGIDERVMNLVDEELSIGDFVTSGGELPAMVMIDAIGRHKPGVVGSFDSVENDSFYDGLLDHENYTRPDEYRGMGVPEVLRNGNHKLIDEERKMNSILRTIIKRPDLFLKRDFDREEKKMIVKLIRELYSNVK